MILTLASEQDLDSNFRQVLSEVFRLHGWTDEDELWLINDSRYAEPPDLPSVAKAIGIAEDVLREANDGSSKDWARLGLAHHDMSKLLSPRVDLALGKCPDFNPRVQTVSVAETLGTAGGKTKLSWAVRQLLKPMTHPPYVYRWLYPYEEFPYIPMGAMVTLDIEVSGDIRVDEPEDTELLSVALAWRSDRDMDGIRHRDETVWGVVLGKDCLEMEYWRDWLADVVENHGLLTHNGKFDLRWINALLGTNVMPTHDTMLLHHSMFPGAAEHGLKPLARRILGAPDWESDAKQYLKNSQAHYERIPQAKLTEYNAWDVYWTLQLFEELLRLAELMGIAYEWSPKGAYEHELSAGEMIQPMEAHGMGVDIEYSEKVDTFYAEMRENALAGVQGFVENPNSVPQIKAAVKKHFNVSLLGTSDKAFKKAMRDHPEAKGLPEFYRNLMDTRTATKARSTYVTSILKKVRNGRVHPTFKIHGTTTGRLSSASPNFQNLPSGGGMNLKRMYRARPGYVIVTADYAQAELRTVAELADDELMIGDLQEDSPDFFKNLTPHIFTDVDFGVEDPKPYRRKVKVSVYGCVPLDTQILTRRGWLTYDQLVGGDETVGMNIETGKAEWTPILDVHRYGEQPVGSLHNSRWGFDVTPGHRWVVHKRHAARDVTQTTDALKHDDIVKTHAPLASMDNPVPDFTLDEMRILTWLLTDGYLNIAPFTGNTSQGSDGRRRKVVNGIQQAKPTYVAEIQGLLERTGMDGNAVQTRPGVNYETSYEWRLPAEKIRGLLRRAGFMDVNGVLGNDLDVDTELVEWLLTLPLEYVEAFFDVFYKAEGHVQGTRKVITQNPGGKMDAVELAATLLGYSTSRTKHGERCQRLLIHKNPYVSCQKLRYEPDRVEEVWCPTTGLGTWTARQVDGRIAITGNSNYGLTCVSIAENLTLDGHPTTVAEAAKIQGNYLGRYDGLKRWRENTMPLVIDGDDLTTPFGRRYQQDVVINNWKMLSRVQNQAWAFRPQSIASDICLRAAMWVWQEFQDNRRYRDCHIVALVHDAIYCEVPEELGEEVLEIVQRNMRKSGASTFHRVPFLTDGTIGPTLGDV